MRFLKEGLKIQLFLVFTCIKYIFVPTVPSRMIQSPANKNLLFYAFQMVVYDKQLKT
jgi:hypothetical protein